MVVKLYGYFLSTVSRRVAAVLHEKEIPFEFVSIDLMKGEHKSAENMAKHPFGQVPYLEDDGFVLYESRAICRYLEEKFPNQGTKLIPSGLRERALFEQGVSIETSQFDTVASPLIFEAVYKKALGLTPDQARIQEFKAKVASTLDVYEKILTKQKYIGGDSLTLADLYHLPYVIMVSEVGVDVIQGRPHVAKWFNEIQNRPSWLAVKDGITSRA